MLFRYVFIVHFTFCLLQRPSCALTSLFVSINICGSAELKWAGLRNSQHLSVFEVSFDYLKLQSYWYCCYLLDIRYSEPIL